MKTPSQRLLLPTTRCARTLDGPPTTITSPRPIDAGSTGSTTGCRHHGSSAACCGRRPQSARSGRHRVGRTDRLEPQAFGDLMHRSPPASSSRDYRWRNLRPESETATRQVFRRNAKHADGRLEGRRIVKWNEGPRHQLGDRRDRIQLLDLISGTVFDDQDSRKDALAAAAKPASPCQGVPNIRMPPSMLRRMICRHSEPRPSDRPRVGPECSCPHRNAGEEPA